MKIFLNDRTIELLDSRPDQPMPNTLVIEYRSGKDIEKRYREFEEDEQVESLVFWSERREAGWKEDFFRLFKRIDAAGGLVKNEKGERLFIFRLGKWDLPKGKLKTKESPEEGAIREVAEETGLSELTINRALHPTWHIYTRKGKEILKRTWWFEMESKSNQRLVPQTEEDISEVRWVGMSELGTVLANTYGSIRSLLVDYC